MKAISFVTSVEIQHLIEDYKPYILNNYKYRYGSITEFIEALNRLRITNSGYQLDHYFIYDKFTFTPFWLYCDEDNLGDELFNLFILMGGYDYEIPASSIYNPSLIVERYKLMFDCINLLNNI